MRLQFDDRSVTYAQFLDDVARKVAHLVRKDMEKELAKEPEMVSTEEAARILSISPRRLRELKDRFPHIKSGESKQGKLLFVRNALLREYAR